LSGALVLRFEDRFDSSGERRARTIRQADLRTEWSESKGGVVVTSGSTEARSAVQRERSTEFADAPIGAIDLDAAMLFAGQSSDDAAWRISPDAVAFLLGPCPSLEFTVVDSGATAVDLLATLRESTRAEITATPMSDDGGECAIFHLEGFIEGRAEHDLPGRPGATQEDSMRVDLSGTLRRSRVDPRCISFELSGDAVLDVLTSGPLTTPSGGEDRIHVRVRSRGTLRVESVAARIEG